MPEITTAIYPIRLTAEQAAKFDMTKLDPVGDEYIVATDGLREYHLLDGTRRLATNNMWNERGEYLGGSCVLTEAQCQKYSRIPIMVTKIEQEKY